MPEWYELRGKEALAYLKTDPKTGLTDPAVEERREQYGWNELKKRSDPALGAKLAVQLRSFQVILLLAGMVGAVLLGGVDAAVGFGLVTLLHTVGRVGQALKTEAVLAAQRSQVAPQARVWRAGKLLVLPARELVPGDLINVEAGDCVPADARLLSADNLQVDEAALTGKAVSVEKDPEFRAADKMPLADQKNMLFMGTVVTSGRGWAVVTATGMAAVSGRVAGSLPEEKAEVPPLQKKVGAFVQELRLLAIGFSLLVFLLGLLRGNNAYEMFLVTISLAVVAMPEGLPTLVSTVLALGVQQMAEEKAVIANAKKALYYLLSCNIGAVLTFFAPILLGWPVPLYPLQILWLNLVTDPLPALALGFELPVGESKKVLPLLPEQELFSAQTKVSVVAYGVFLAAITLLAFRLGMRHAVATGQTMAFATLGLGQLINAFNFRSLHQSGGQRGLMTYRSLLLGMGGSLLLQLFVFFTPLLRRLFRVQGLSLREGLTVLGLAFTPIIFGALLKSFDEKFAGESGGS